MFDGNKKVGPSCHGFKCDPRRNLRMKGIRAVTDPTTSNTTSSSDMVRVPLKPTKILPRLQRLSGWYPS